MKPDLIEKYMWLAIHEGKKATGKCRPNPPVGCVLVRDNRVIAVGHTGEPGKPHAEAMAIGEVSGPLSDVSVFVTLEPCSFEGRTPSCAKTLVSRNVKEVYVGVIDPHPRNRGAGIELIENAGIPVTIGVLAPEIHRLLYRYLYSGDDSH